MATNSWLNTIPASGETVSTGDDRMRLDRVDVYERLVQGGHFVDNVDAVGVATKPDDGKHVVGIGADGGPHIFQSNKSTKLVNYTNDTTVDMTNATSGVIGPNITTGTDPGHKHSGSIIFRIPGALTGGRQKILFDSPRNYEIYLVQLVVFTRPTGGSQLEVDIFDLAAPADGVDRATAGASIFDAGQTPKLTAASTNYSVTVSGAIFKVAASSYIMVAGNELGMSIVTTGTSTADLVVYIYARKL